MKLILAAAIVLSMNSYAQIISAKPTCKIEAKTGLLSGGGMIISRPITEDECFKIGEDYFNSPVTEGTNIINPLNNTVTERMFSTQNKRVKAIYLSPGGKSSKTFKRSHVERVMTSEKITKIESGFRCWTKGECVAVEE